MIDIVKESYNDYALVKSEKWFDPEGIDNLDDIDTIFCGSFEQCKLRLDKLYNDAYEKTQREQDSFRKSVIIRGSSDTTLNLYYPRAQIKVNYGIVELDKLTYSND